MNLFPSSSVVAPAAAPAVIKFFAAGTPKGQPRARAFARKMGGKFVARVFDAGTAEGWKGDIALAARPHKPAAPIDCACSVEIDFLFARPQRLLKKSSPKGRIRHTAKPDRDNCEKAVTDCLTRLGFFRDDAVICDGPVRKFYVAIDETPGAWITIKLLEGGGHV